MSFKLREASYGRPCTPYPRSGGAFRPLAALPRRSSQHRSPPRFFGPSAARGLHAPRPLLGLSDAGLQGLSESLGGVLPRKQRFSVIFLSAWELQHPLYVLPLPLLLPSDLGPVPHQAAQHLLRRAPGLRLDAAFPYRKAE